MERLERLTRVSPGFRQKVVQPPLRLATPRWVVDPDFDLSWHIRRFEAAPPRTLATVLEFARKTGMAGLDRDRPLWEATFIEGLEGGQTAVVMKLHHSLTDGVGGMDIARLLFDVEPDPGDLGAMPEAPGGENLGTVDLVRDALGYGWSRALRLLASDISPPHPETRPTRCGTPARRSPRRSRRCSRSRASSSPRPPRSRRS